jgi:hypothetical protein
MKPIVVTLLAVLLTVTAVVMGCREQHQQPLGEAPTLNVSSPDMTQDARREFLNRDFTVVKDVRLLPQGVIDKFTEKDGTRLVIANPGKDFVVGDVIYDDAVPRERLILAGISGQKCFVHYESGGRAHTYQLVLFEVTQADAKPLWRGYCTGAVTNVGQLRSACH